MDKASALRVAQGMSRRPDTVRPHPHLKLEYAKYSPGFVFVDEDGYLLVAGEVRRSGPLPEGVPVDDAVEAVVEEHFQASLPPVDLVPLDRLGEEQRLAVAAFDAGADTVDSSGANADYATYLLTAMRRRPGRAVTGHEILSRQDWLREPPEPGLRYTHPCPLCGRPTIHRGRYPREVCHWCSVRTVDRDGRRITGYNRDMSGGFFARYVDPPEVECVEVTETGRCFVDGHQVTMGEAHFGGIVVEAT